MECGSPGGEIRMERWDGRDWDAEGLGLALDATIGAWDKVVSLKDVAAAATATAKSSGVSKAVASLTEASLVHREGWMVRYGRRKIGIQAAKEFINDLPDHTVSTCPAPYAPELK